MRTMILMGGLFVAVAIAGFAGVACAAEDSFVEGHYSLTNVTVKDNSGAEDDENFSGGGVAGRVRLGDAVLRGDYNTVSKQGLDFDLLRLGAGYAFEVTRATFYVAADYVRLGVNTDIGEVHQDGAGAFGGIYSTVGSFTFSGELGYAFLDDIDGPAYDANIVYNGLAPFGIGVGYRFYQLEDEEKNRLNFNELRLGFRYWF